MTYKVFARVAGVIILIGVIIAISERTDLTYRQGGPEVSRIKINASQAKALVQFKLKPFAQK